MSILVTSQTLGATRNNFPGTLGLVFRVGSQPLVVTALGRWIVSGNNATHTLYLWDTTLNAVVASVSLNANGQTAGQYAYATLSSPFTTIANRQYFLGSSETNGGDLWYDSMAITLSADAGGSSDAYSSSVPPTGVSAGPGGVGFSYVPVNMQYSYQTITPNGLPQILGD